MTSLGQQLFHWALIAVLYLQVIGGCAESLTNFTYTQNGVRLVGGDESHGRVEVLPRQPWASKTWVQVCDSSFTDLMAENLCQILGYQFGRKYYTEAIAFPGSKVTSIKASGISCFVGSSGYRRELDEEGLISADDDAVTHQDVDTGGVSRQGRKLLAPLWGYIDAPELSPTVCQFRVGTCNPVGPVAGLQCSNLSLPSAPLPPPAPPSPPPPPPAASNLIRFLASYTSRGDGPIEPNLCNNTNTSSVCNAYGRIEIQINYTINQICQKIWVPVCNISDPTLASKVAKLACEQRFQERRLPWLPNVWYISARVSTTPFYIPSANQVVDRGDFNSTAVKRYLTINGGNVSKAKALQELRWKATSAPCRNNAMLAIGCSLASNDGAIP
ncbi:hypothetical protein Vafri_14927 [Volvox africanus]|uniref:SRCR domain-containing protein n=1 Tax=Volvox africanus TaxID=51714 RepID=A0A8J4BF63_9CHLO|nr:hypothetical protein Vafri_14927 [Volvox africanus]